MMYIPVDEGVDLAVQDLNPGANHTLVFVHGWPLSKEIFEYQYNVLPYNDICCISYDLRGYGNSSRPAAGYDYDQMADDLAHIIDSLKTDTVTLLGFSMGGAITIRYMARHEGYKVSKLILCGAAAPKFVKSPEHPHGMPVEQVNDLIAQCYVDRPAMLEAFGKLCFAQNHSPALLDWWYRLGLKAAGHSTIQSLVALREEDLSEDLGKIQVPALILHGKLDRVCPFPLAEEMHEAITGSKLVPFENSSHALFLDESVKFTQQLLDFARE